MSNSIKENLKTNIFPYDFVKENEVFWRNELLKAGVSNVDQIVNANGQSFVQWFASMNTTGKWTEAYTTTQKNALGDPSRGLPRDSRIDDWLTGLPMQLASTQSGKATVTSLAYEWLGPLYGKLEDSKIDNLASIYRNAESEEVGKDLVQEKLKSMKI